MSRTLTAVVVDDERPARLNLKALLAEFDDVEVIGEAGSADALDDLLESVIPDVVFLDISMPGRSGLEWCRSRTDRDSPRVVLVTAHAPHALEAYDLEVLDYVLKPVRRDRLAQALGRVREVESGPSSSSPSGRIPIRYASREVLVDPEAVRWIRAEGNYVQLDEGGRTHLVRSSFEKLLAEFRDHFVQLHRSSAVRVRVVREIRRRDGGWFAVLDDDTELPIARRRLAAVRRRLRAD